MKPVFCQFVLLDDAGWIYVAVAVVASIDDVTVMRQPVE